MTHTESPIEPNLACDSCQSVSSIALGFVVAADRCVRAMLLALAMQLSTVRIGGTIKPMPCCLFMLTLKQQLLWPGWGHACRSMAHIATAVAIPPLGPLR